MILLYTKNILAQYIKYAPSWDVLVLANRNDIPRNRRGQVDGLAYTSLFGETLAFFTCQDICPSVSDIFKRIGLMG
jgi:hypothetical protein